MNSLIPKPNKEQQEAIEHVQGPLIIVAGAGTGKTAVITEKIKYLLANKLADASQIMALTFNEKAAAEMQARVDRAIDYAYLEMNIHTFHAFCQRLLEKYAIDIGLPASFKILTPADAWLLVRKNLDKFELDYYRPIGNPTKNIHELIKHFQKCKDEMISPEDYLNYALNIKLDKDNVQIEEKNRLTEISRAYHVYNQLLVDNSCLDFGDLIYYANILLIKRPNILNKIHQRYKYILVDEFQDVNWAQYELVKKITNKSAQLTVVGDDDQSIYAFRGASVSNILKFKEDFPNAHEIVLTTNYRSGQTILDKAYQLIQNNNPDRLEIKLNINKKLINNIEKKSHVAHVHLSKLDDEAKFTTEEIIKLKKLNPNASWNDFAILIRANSHAEPFMNQMEAFGIPYEFLASAGLYRQPIILDCINFFKVIDNYRESASIYRLMRMPAINLNEDDIQQITYFAKKIKVISYFEALKRNAEIKLSEKGRKKIETLLSAIQEGLASAINNKPTLVLYKFLESSGYLKYLLDGENKGNNNVIRQIYQLTQFFEYIANYEKMTPDSTVADFMDHFSQILDSGDLGIIKQPEDTPDSVNILTVHTAKGLEFKYVFVVNLVEERFPARRRGELIELPKELIKEQLPEGDGHEQEERRLFYVAMTRAKERLYLLSANDYGGARSKKISRFLPEIGYQAINQNTDIGSRSITHKKPRQESSAHNLNFEIPSIFSFTDIQTYGSCPYKYKLSRILKLPTQGSPSMTFGSVMHKTLEEFYQLLISINSLSQNSLFNNEPIVSMSHNKELKAPTLEILYEIYDSCWRSDSYVDTRQREDFYEKGKNILLDFYKLNQKTGWSAPLALETKFKIKIGEIQITGRIDRVDKISSGNIEIIDYKTGKSKEKLTTDDKEQLLIYQIAMEIHPQFKNAGQCERLTYYFLNDGKKLSFTGSEDDTEKLCKKINNIVDSIKQNNFAPKPEKFYCGHCDFRDICDYRL
jgi:DNA helicase-2/ATP-dependent DNA helicase PcrA